MTPPPREAVSAVWFKRDLRLSDHGPLAAAVATGLPLLLVYVWEPPLWEHPDYDPRHARFITESLAELNVELARGGHRLVDFFAEAEPTWRALAGEYDVRGVYSHEEVGIDLTYRRDLRMREVFAQLDVPWHETQFSGVQRGLRTRATWRKQWYAYMDRGPTPVDLRATRAAAYPDALDSLRRVSELPAAWQQRDPAFQQGGPSLAREYLDSFLTNRIGGYRDNISKPGEARDTCSRLSPYLAWGNVSLREVYHAQWAARQAGALPKADASAFASRLRWRDHFIQKFESEPSYEFDNLNPAYDGLREEINEDYLRAFAEGRTGFALVDACMRCARATGYLNFRMRAMVTSFWTHTLWQPWRPGAHVLARYWLDYEPGIHYPQTQMQAGVTGINAIRIYNPILNGQKHDPEAAFTKHWVPELAGLSPKRAHQPETAPPLELELAGVRLGETYPYPIVERVAAYRHANARLREVKSSDEAKRHGDRIKARLVNPGGRWP